MSLQMKLAELQYECESLGLQPRQGRRAKPGKAEYIGALADYYIGERRKEGTLTRGAEWVHENLWSPMLATSSTQVKPEAVEMIKADPDYGIQEKFDGCRCIVCWFPGEGFTFFGRNRSVKDFLHVEYSNQFLGLEMESTASLFDKPFVLDTEVTATSPEIRARTQTQTQLEAVCAVLAMEREDSHALQLEYPGLLEFHVFDLLMLDGVEYFDEPYCVRLEHLDSVMNALEAREATAPFKRAPVYFGLSAEEKDRFTDKVIGRGGEGSVLKHRNSAYVPSENRPTKHPDVWLKQKKTVSQSIGADIDAYVTGFSLGGEDTANADIVSVLHFSVRLMPSGVEHEIAMCSNFTQEFKRSITVPGADGRPVLAPEMYGRVAVVDGMDVSSTVDHGAARFSHAKFIRWREGADAKTPDECTFNEDVLAGLVR